MKYTSLLFKSHRVGKAWSKSHVSRELKLTPQFYGQIERGRVNLPPQYYKKIIKILSIPEQYLIDALVADYIDEINKYL